MTGPRIESDYREVDRELSRISDLPGHTGGAALDTALAAVFAETEAIVHVRTGALRGSGKVHSNTEDGQWSGQMTFGGPSPGFLPRPSSSRGLRLGRHAVKDQTSRMEVVYAWYEMRRGGSHDYFRLHDQYDHQIGVVVADIVSGHAL